VPVHHPPAVQAKPAASQRILPVPAAVVQCKLNGKIVKAAAALAMGGTLGVLTYDNQNPQPQHLDQNRDILILAIRAQGGGVNNEHLKQVASEIQKSTKPRKLPFTPYVEMVHQIVRVEHLDEFAKSSEKFTGETSAKTVVLLARVDGMPVTDAPPQESGDAASLRVPPNGGQFAQSSSGDGEVEPLIDTLDKFYVYLEDEANQTANRHFTVALAGGWGACEGCKVRIARFRQLWSAKAAACMQQGTIARLTITYRYKSKPAEVFGGNYYGWREDSKRDDWYWHTETDQVNGTRQP
jgi:hypothetical protein